MKKLITTTLALQLLIQPVWAQTLNETFETSTATATTAGLTDQEQTAATNYYHQGVAERVLAEQCKKLKTGCNDTTGRPGNVLGGFEEVLPKLYAVMGTLAAAGVGNKIKMNGSATPARATPPSPPGTSGSTAANPASTPGTGNQRPQQREKTDVCIYIPMAGEAIAMFTQQQAEQQIQQQATQNQADLQREALYAVARTQNSRAKTAKLQASVYAATGACYVAYMAMGASLSDPMLWVKMGAATAMSAIFFKKSSNHKKYANQLKEIAASLPGAGECNPYTNTNCFCAEATSFQTDPANFNRFCVPQTIASNGPPGTQIACATLNSAGQAVIDEACQCRAANTCVNAQLRGLSGQLGLSGIGFSEPLAILDNSVGTFNDATLGNLSEGLNATNLRTLAGGSKVIPETALSGKTKELADKIASLGVPAGLSGALASQPSAAMPSNLAVAPDLAPIATPAAVQSGSQAPGYNAAAAARGAGGNGETPFVDPLAALNNKGQKPASVQVETFAEKAIREAEINRDSSRNLFEVISNRYRTSGWGQASNPTP